MYKSLSSMNLFPSEIISISVHLINKTNNLAFAGSAPYSSIN